MSLDVQHDSCDGNSQVQNNATLAFEACVHAADLLFPPVWQGFNLQSFEMYLFYLSPVLKSVAYLEILYHIYKPFLLLI